MSVLKVTAENFEKEVLNSDKLVITDFWAPWCGPCKMMEPLLENIVNANRDNVILVKINVDEEPELTSQYQIVSIPTMLFFKDGQVVSKQVGAVPQHAIEELVKKSL
jgi:thioredoxin 1